MLSIKLLLTYPQKISIKIFPIIIAAKNFLRLIRTTPQIILTKKAGVNGKATTSTKFEKEILRNLMIDFSTFSNVFLERSFSKNFFERKEKKVKEIKQPRHVAIQDIKIPMIPPKAFTFKATKTPKGKTGKKDSKRINKKPKSSPP